MHRIEWSADLDLGIPSLDRDHRRLVDLANAFFAAAESGRDKAALNGLMIEIIDLTRDHFAREETLLDRSDYPDLPAHKLEHANLLEDAKLFRDSYANGEAQPQVTIEAAEFLSRWLLDHIRNQDKRFAPFVHKLA